MLLHRRRLQQQQSEAWLVWLHIKPDENIYTPRRHCRSTEADADVLKGLFVVPGPFQSGFR